MSYKIEAIFDGAVFRPETPVDLAPNTRATLTVEPEKSKKKDKSVSFFDVALSFHVESPPDFVENLDEYLYGDMRPKDE